MRTLVFEQRHAPIHQLGDEVGVEVPTRGRQGKAARGSVEVAHPVAHARMTVDELGAGEFLAAVLQIGQHRKVVSGKPVAPRVARGHGRGVAVGLEDMRMRPVGLDQPGAARIALAQHLLPKGAPRRALAQIGGVMFDGPRQAKTPMRQRHQRHATAVQLVIDHGRQPGATLRLRQARQVFRLEQRLVEPAHQRLRVDAARVPVHRHLGAIGQAQGHALVLHIDLDHVGLLRRLKAGQLHRRRRKPVDFHRLQHRLALQRPQRRLRLRAPGQMRQRRERQAMRGRRGLRRHQRAVLRQLLAQLRLFPGASHQGQQQRFSLLPDGADQHHPARVTLGRPLHARLRQQFGGGRQTLKERSYRRLPGGRWRLI